MSTMKNSTTTMTSRAARGARRRVKGLLGGGIGLTVLVAAVMLAAPLTSAHGTVTFSPPYTTFTNTPSNYASQVGCAAEKQTTAPTWNSTTGTFQVASSTTAGKCAGSNFGEAYTSVSLGAPLFSAPYAGYGSVYATISSAFSAKAALHLATLNASNSSYVFGEASVSVTVSVYVYDATHHNDTFFGYATDTLVSQYFTTTGTYSISSGWTTSYAFASGMFTGGHVYSATVVIEASVFVETYGGGSTAGASVDLSGSNGLTLVSLIAS